MLDQQKLLSAIDQLTRKDPHLNIVVEKYGPPPLWSREPGFPSLVKIILEQQVSLASANAAYDKLLEATDPLTPETFLILTTEQLKMIGFSRQKTRYCRILAESLLNGELDLDELAKKCDSDVMRILTSLKGIGPWTASIYMLMALRRPDVWPRGDHALLLAMKEVKKLECKPGPDKAAQIAEEWIPWRSVAARILWHSYLCERAGKT